MSERDYKLSDILVGGAVLAAVVSGIVYVSGFVGVGLGTADEYELHASFLSAEGIGPGTEVRLAGVRVGQVTSIDLDVGRFVAETIFTMRGDIELPDDSTVAIASDGLIGDAFLEVVPGVSPFELEPGDTVLDAQSPASLVSVLIGIVARGEGP